MWIVTFKKDTVKYKYSIPNIDELLEEFHEAIF